jgi:hypothetical protein
VRQWVAIWLQYAGEGTERRDQAMKEEYTLATKFIKKTDKCTWIYEYNFIIQ